MEILFASDFDGTFYFRDGFHKEDIDSIHRFQSNGYRFGLCTGRSYTGVMDVVKNLINFDFYILVTGSYLLAKDKTTIYELTIDTNIAKEIFQKYKDNYSIAINTGKDYIITSDRLDVFKEELRPFPENERIFCVSICYRSNKEANEEKKKIENNYPYLTAHQNGTYLDITDKRCSKGNAVEMLRKQYEKPFVFGIGDNYNDITLLDSADVSFTFTYSDDEVKKHADYVVNNLKEAIEIAESLIAKGLR